MEHGFEDLKDVERIYLIQEYVLRPRMNRGDKFRFDSLAI